MSNPVTFLAGAINNKEPIGVAILVAFNDKTDDRFNRGLQKDIEKMSNVFTELKFVVCVCKQTVADVKSIIRAASMYNEYPDSLQYICFYYTGHGGINSQGHPYILDENLEHLLVTNDIVSPFFPENAKQLGERIRLFFFDCCLSKEPIKKARTSMKSLLLPARGNCLISFSTAIESESNVDTSGSYWTDILSTNLVLDEPLSTILDVTHKQTVSFCREKFTEQKDIQGPHYVSCVGPVYLKGLKESFKKKTEISGSCGLEESFKNKTEISESFGTPDILNTAPDEHNLLELLADINHQWFVIGLALHISINDLSGLQSVQLDNTVKLLQVIHIWLTTRPSPVTWKTVISAVEGRVVGNLAKANEIRDHLGLPRRQ